MKTLAGQIAEAGGATCDIDYILGYPAIENDAALAGFARASAVKILGKDNVFDAPTLTMSEDFSYYKDVAPECFLILGVGDGVANHNPKFPVDESALLNGVKTEVQVILDYLNQQSADAGERAGQARRPARIPIPPARGPR